MNCRRAEFARRGYKVSRFGTQKRDRNLGWKRCQFRPFETRNEHMVLQAVFEDEPFHVVRYSGILQFDVQQESAAESIENVCQKRDALSESGIELPQLLIREIGNAALAVGGPVDGFVVDDDDPAVGASANVELDAVGAVLQRFLEGPDCVFG